MQPIAIATADFNRDGNLDLVVTNYSGNSVSILIGNGDGSFQKHLDFNTGSFPDSVAVRDFNKDGKLDLAVANVESKSVSVLLGNGDGSFRKRVDYAVSGVVLAVALGDFDGDGELDIAASATCNAPGCTSGRVTVLRGKGDGTFVAGVSFVVGDGPTFVAVGDFNGDSRPDLVTTNIYNTSMSVLLNATKH